MEGFAGSCVAVMATQLVTICLYAKKYTRTTSPLDRDSSSAQVKLRDGKAEMS